jgi:hypothetical protein
MQATNLVFRDDLFVINEIDAPFALKGGIVKNLRIELPIVGAALLNRARIKVRSSFHSVFQYVNRMQVKISGLHLVLRLADQNHIADDMPHSIVSHIVAELQVRFWFSSTSVFV